MRFVVEFIIIVFRIVAAVALILWAVGKPNNEKKDTKNESR